MNTAKQAIEHHAQAINRRDAEAYIESTNFPFTYQNYNGVALTVESAQHYKASAALPWEIVLKTDPLWSHSEFEPLQQVARSVSSVVYKVRFRRFDSAGQSDGIYQAIWIASCMDGHWGVQFRHNLGMAAE